MAGIYIHIPFCKQACYYCDFHFMVSTHHKDAVIDSLKKEIRLRAKEIGEPVETIYFGGGTPSILKTSEIQILLDTVYENFEVIANPEITLEANPDDLSPAKITELARTAVNRLSVGVQSFYDDDLRFMNRAHSGKEALDALNQIRPFFRNITVDLIYGIPGLTDEKWRNNIQKLLDLEIPHISAYALTVEKRTALAHFIRKGKYPPLNEDQAERQYRILVELTKDAGFSAYEISNFGKPGWFSKHNTAYWQGKPYIGIGPSAHSYNKGVRSWNIASNSKYIKAINKGVLPSEKEVLTENEQFNELIMTGLRTMWGVSLAEVKHRFGPDCAARLINTAQKFIDEGLLDWDGGRLKLTEKGRFLADGIAAELFWVT